MGEGFYCYHGYSRERRRKKSGRGTVSLGTEGVERNVRTGISCTYGPTQCAATRSIQKTIFESVL